LLLEVADRCAIQIQELKIHHQEILNIGSNTRITTAQQERIRNLDQLFALQALVVQVVQHTFSIKSERVTVTVATMLFIATSEAAAA